MTDRLIKRLSWAQVVAICACISLAAGGYSVRSSGEPGPQVAQEVMILDRRISSLEQRLYSIESSIRNLQQQVAASGRSIPTPAPAQPGPGVDLLRSEVETLRNRVRELECGLVRVDERTLSPAAREGRRRAGSQFNDPCRLNPHTPVQLSTRQ